MNSKQDDGTRYHVIRDGVLRMTVKGSELKATDIVEGVDEPDSRLKLDHAAQRLAYIFADNYSDDSELYGEIIELLDRQAAITANEYRDNFTGFGLLHDLNESGISVKYLPDERRFVFDDHALVGYQAKVDSLQAELDKWNKLAENIELPDYPMTQFVPKDEWRKLEARIHEWLTSHVGVSVYTNEIESEAKKWMNKAANIRGREIGFQMESWAKRVDDQSCEIERLKAERDNLAADLAECMELNDKLSDEREKWRGTCGMMMDKAHEIQRVMAEMEAK